MALHASTAPILAMPVAQGTCPSCGAPIEFGVGSSIAKVCPYCSATVRRTDRGLENLGKVAAIANTPSLISVGDSGSLAGRPFQVMGRVQLDHGKGPWDEYYVAFDQGNTWGWLAYAQGRWHVTEKIDFLQIPPYQSLRLEMDLPLGNQVYRVVEVKSGRVVSTEGELPETYPAGSPRLYADCFGRNGAFATVDYGDGSGRLEVFVGWVFAESQLQVQQLGPRRTAQVQTDMIKCPACGGDIPKLSGERAQRVGCPYCGALSEIATQRIIAQQEAALSLPAIPIGSRGTFDGIEYLAIAYLRRSSTFDGEDYEWEEFLLWSQPLGYRWLVKDPETGWSWATEANPADIVLSGAPSRVVWGGRTFTQRNRNRARVEYVLGEVYWQCEVGETTQVTDYAGGQDVLSREEGSGEVHYTHSVRMAWPAVASAFGLPLTGSGEWLPSASGADSSAEGSGNAWSGWVSAIVVIGFVALILVIVMMDNCGSSGGGVGGVYIRSGSGSTSRGSGSFSGGK